MNTTIYTIKVKDIKTFHNIFGADCFVEFFPKILTEGIEAILQKSCYYIIDQNKQIIHNTCFFTEEELKWLIISKKG